MPRVTVTIIFGEDAVRKYSEGNKLPNARFLNRHGGKIVQKEFKSEEEYNSYVEALKESSSYYDWMILTPVLTPDEPDTPDDCRHCEHWRNFFSDREFAVYCPDCGKKIANLDKTNIG